MGALQVKGAAGALQVHKAVQQGPMLQRALLYSVLRLLCPACLWPPQSKHPRPAALQPVVALLLLLLPLLLLGAAYRRLVGRARQGHSCLPYKRG